MYRRICIILAVGLTVFTLISIAKKEKDISGPEGNIIQIMVKKNTYQTDINRDGKLETILIEKRTDIEEAIDKMVIKNDLGEPIFYLANVEGKLIMLNEKELDKPWVLKTYNRAFPEKAVGKDEWKQISYDGRIQEIIRELKELEEKGFITRSEAPYGFKVSCYEDKEKRWIFNIVIINREGKPVSDIVIKWNEKTNLYEEIIPSSLVEPE